MNSSYRTQDKRLKEENKFRLTIHKQFQSQFRTLTVRQFYEERLEGIEDMVLKDKVYVFYSAFRPKNRQPSLFFPNIYKLKEETENLDTVLLEVPKSAIKQNDY